MNSKIKIIKVLSSDLNTSFTIREISKKIRMSYGFTNKLCWEMIREGILKKQNVGASILCSLNHNCEITLGLLVLSSVYKNKELLDKYEEKIKLVEKEVDSVFLYHDTLCVMTDNKICFDDIRVYDKNSLKSFLKTSRLENITLLNGYEKFWRLVRNV